TWTLQPSGITAGSFINSVHFFDAQNGVILGDQDEQGYFEIYTTANAGVTWTRVPLANLPPAQNAEFGLTNIFEAVGDAVWFVTGTNGTTPRRLFRSFNKGQTWTATNIAGM